MTPWKLIFTSLALFLGVYGEGCADILTSDQKRLTPTKTARQGFVEQLIEATWDRGEDGFTLTVSGLSSTQLDGIHQNGRDVMALSANSKTRADNKVDATATGFRLTGRLPGETWLDPNQPLLLETRLGSIVATPASALNCPASISFGWPTLPALEPVDNCGYNSPNCNTAGMRHTGINYSGAGDAIAITGGLVVRVETLNADDHGLGNNVIVKHVLPGPHCAVVYSTYSRLDSIAVSAGDVVEKGQLIGTIGRSGYGDPDYWSGAHLHLEMKATAVTGNPMGTGNQSKTCAIDPLNAKANSCWSFLGRARLENPNPDEMGYLDPLNYLNKTHTTPLYRQVSAGDHYNCALKVDNTLFCWGENRFGETVPRNGMFQQVSSGKLYHNSELGIWQKHTCGIKADGLISCWGSNDYGQASPPIGRYRQVASGARHTCAIRIDNTVRCWGSLNTAPSGRFKQISASGHNLLFNDQVTCGITADNWVRCWGSNGFQNTPTNPVKKLSVGDAYACAIMTNDRLYCWSRGGELDSYPTDRDFREVSVGYGHGCGITTDNTLICWGGIGTPPPGSYRQIISGDGYSCAVKIGENRLQCWGKNLYGEATPPSGTVKMISSGKDITFRHVDDQINVCELKTNNTLACFGYNESGQTLPPAGQFKQVSTGHLTSCAITLDNHLKCWGELSSIEEADVKQVSVGANNIVCGLKTNGSLIGSNCAAIAATNGFIEASAGEQHACALKSDKTLSCKFLGPIGIGEPFDIGQANPPIGVYKQVSAGSFHNCAIKTDNTLACWGSQKELDGVFRTVSAGDRHSCAINPDNSLTCWRTNSGTNELLTVPAGSFRQISAGEGYDCAVRADKFVTCWGGIVR